MSLYSSDEHEVHVSTFTVLYTPAAIRLYFG